MSRWRLLPVVSLACLLAACGSPQRRGPARRPPSTPPSTAPSETPAPQPLPPPPVPPVAAPAVPPPPAPTTKTTTTAPPSAATSPEFEADQFGGKTISQWIGQLSSKNKEQLIEALEVCSAVGKKAGRAAPRIGELVNDPDPDIAKAARQALHDVQRKDW